MVLEKEIPVFLEWIGGAALDWAVVIAILAVVAVAFAHVNAR